MHVLHGALQLAWTELVYSSDSDGLSKAAMRRWILMTRDSNIEKARVEEGRIAFDSHTIERSYYGIA